MTASESDASPFRDPRTPIAPNSLAPPAPHGTGAFTTGSVLSHVLVMTATGSLGLIAVFAVDFLTLLYVAHLGDTNLTAAVGYASQIMFLLISVNIGISIAVGALVSRAEGARDRARARIYAGSGLVLAGLVSAVLVCAIWPFAERILALFGARGEALRVGALYLRIALPAMVFVGIGMSCAAILRGIGDAKRAMLVTLGGAVVTLCLDPIFIFVLHLGVEGAAVVLILSRVSLLLVGLHGTVRVHGLVRMPNWREFRDAVGSLGVIAAPATLTNVASPISNIFVMHVFSKYGDAVVAAFAIMDRVSPVAFGVLFALSGSVGPIMGQNFGAANFPRVRQTLTVCLGIAAAYVLAISIVLWLGAPLILAAFNAKGTTAELLRYFCHVSGPFWLFLGAIFVSNAAFNNLGRPLLSAGFNWARATIGTVPFLLAGSMLAGPEGGYAGLICGAVLFGVAAVATAFAVVNALQKRQRVPDGAQPTGGPQAPEALSRL